MTDREDMRTEMQLGFEQAVAVWLSLVFVGELQRLNLACAEVSKTIVQTINLLRLLQHRLETPRQRKYRLRDERRRWEMQRQYEAWQRRKEQGRASGKRH